MVGKKTPVLTDSETAYVRTLLKGDDPLYIRWMTKRKRDKVQDRLLVVGKHRIFSIKKTMTGKKQVQRDAHIFDLVGITSQDVDRAVLRFKSFEIDVSESSAGTELIQIVRSAHQVLSYGFPEYALPKIALMPAERQLQPLPSIDPGLAHGFFSTYEGWCDYYSSPPSQDFTKYVQDVIASGSTELVMENCPGIERKENPIDFIPIRAALRHNTFFTGFILHNIPRRDVTLCMADALVHNVTLSKIVLSGNDSAEAAIVAFGGALKKNTHNAVTDLDLSKTPALKEKGIQSLSEGLQSFTHGLVKLNLALCGLTTKAVTNLLSAMCYGKEVGITLVELDLSHNNIGEGGSVQFASWFQQEGCGNNLKYLLLSNTKLDVGLVMKAVRNGKCTNLVEIDISANKIDQSGAGAVAGVAEINPHLKVLNTANCGMNSPAAVAVVSGIVANNSIQGASINLSRNELGVVGAQNIGVILGNAVNIGSLVMSACGFKKEGMTKISEAVGINSTLKALDISINLHTGSSAKMTKVMNELSVAVKKHPALEHLAIQGDGDKFAVGKEVMPLINAIAENPHLTELDITGNRIGDELAVQLTNALRTNTHIKSLLWDKNNIGIGGWQALLNILGQNKTLVSCPVPRYDIEKAIKDAKVKDVFKDRLRDVMDKIQSALKENAGGASFSSEYLAQKRGRSYTVKQPPTRSNSFINNFNGGHQEQHYYDSPDAAPWEADTTYTAPAHASTSYDNYSYDAPDVAPPVSYPESDYMEDQYEDPPPPPPPMDGPSQYAPPPTLQEFHENYDSFSAYPTDQSEEPAAEEYPPYEEPASLPPPPPPPPPF